MNKLKVCFVGFGSIAKRHMKNLLKVCSEEKIELMIDLYRSRKGAELEKEYYHRIHMVYYDVDKTPDNYDIVFITNPTEYHLKSIEEFQKKGKSFFIEKPLTTLDKIFEADCFKRNEQKLYYVACPLRYKQVIQYVKNQLDLSAVYSVRVISSSYLPDWRPETDYRTVYSAKKELGGGVALDLIHEWDYVKYLFGMPEEVKCITGKISDLEISSEDIALYIARYENMMAEIHLDYFGRQPIRELQMFMKNETILCDLIRNDIRFLKSGQILHFDEARDEFQTHELKHFLKILEGKQKNSNSIEEALRTLSLAGGKI